MLVKTFNQLAEGTCTIKRFLISLGFSSFVSSTCGASKKPVLTEERRKEKRRERGRESGLRIKIRLKKRYKSSIKAPGPVSSGAHAALTMSSNRGQGLELIRHTGTEGSRGRDAEWLKMAGCKGKAGFLSGGGYALEKTRRGS